MQALFCKCLQFFVEIIMSMEMNRDSNCYRVYLEPISFSEHSVALYKKWFNDPKIQKQMGYIGDSFDDSDVQRWKESQIKDKNRIEMNIVIRETKMIIGMCSVVVDENKKEGEIELLIGEASYRNHGVGTEALCLLMDHCFIKLGLTDLSISVLNNNTPAIKCYKKVGFLKDKSLSCNNNGILKMKNHLI